MHITARAIRLPLLLCAAVFVLAFPKTAADGVRTGLSLCAHAVIPALFPFAVLSPMLSDAVHACFPQSGAKASLALSFMLGILTGFPIGALSVISAYESGYIKKESAERWMGICSGTGPAFLIGYVGVGLFESAALGFTLVALQCASALLAACIFCRSTASAHGTYRSVQGEKKKPTSLFTEVGTAATKMLSVCGFIVFFSVVRAFLALFSSLGALSPHLILFIGGMLEMTGGIADAAATAGAAAPILTAFFVGFGGICVLGQIGLFAQRAGLSMQWYLMEKLVCGVICMGIMTLLI